jgi:transcriptional regulator with XRE-family HTH domain
MSREDLAQLKNRIKKIREIFNLSKSGFAKKLGISPAYVTDLESGKKNNISLPLAKLIFYEFGINPDWLLTGEGPMFREKGFTTQQEDISPEVMKALRSHPTIEKIVLMLSEMSEDDIKDIHKRVEEKTTLRHLLKKVKDLETQLKKTA